MRGVFFTQFLEMIEQLYGLGTVERILEIPTKSEGVYTTGSMYPTQEFDRLVDEAAAVTKTSRSLIGEQFGEHFMAYMTRREPEIFERYNSTTEFLQDINEIVASFLYQIDPSQRNPKFEIHRLDEKLLIEQVEGDWPVEISGGIIRYVIRHFKEEQSLVLRENSIGNFAITPAHRVKVNTKVSS